MKQVSWIFEFIIIIIVSRSSIFTPVLTDGFSLESE